MHKDMHCAVIIDCWMDKMGEISFENRPSKFPAFIENVRRICGSKEIVFGLYNKISAGCYQIEALQ